jgi:UDP-N-acetylglucosamine acyltransferase
MAINVSNLAQVDAGAELDDDVTIGPFCVIGPHVRIGSGTVLEGHVTVLGHTTIGRRNRLFSNAVIGGEPQDVSYHGSPTRLEIGDDNVFREGVTVNRGADKEDLVTRIGNRNLLMANCHVAHNCQIRDQTILVNGVLLGGHVHVHDGAIVSGNTVVHHYSTVGTLSFVSGGCRVSHDMPPYMLASGSERMLIHTVNLVGLQRRGISSEVIQVLKRAHRLLYREFKKVSLAREILRDELQGEWPRELENLLTFVEEQLQGKNGRGRERERRRAA